jgi:hypothetical protein
MNLFAKIHIILDISIFFTFFKELHLKESRFQPYSFLCTKSPLPEGRRGFLFWGRL